MATSDNHSHNEEKTDPSTIKKRSGMENEEEQLESLLTNLKIKDPLPSNREDIRVRFLINVPVGVTPEMSSNAESHCQKFLDLLQRTAFKQEDKHRIEDIAVVFGLNGNESEETNVRNEFEKNVKSEISFEKLMFMWSEKNGIPYRKIREDIKESECNKDLIKNFRENNSKVRIYFCFFDADTVDFNEVLSSYIDVVKDHNYPTLMSTGYLFPEDSEERNKSEQDREVRIITAKHFPLGTYYPEPNFCVLLPDECKTLPECFDYSEDSLMNMESPVLIRQVKKRDDFSAVFANENPIIIPVSRQKQFHTNRSTWAISAYAHGELKVTEKYKQETFGEEYEKDKRKANRSYKQLLMKLVKSDEEAQKVEEMEHFEGPGAGLVFQAAKAVRRYRSRIGLVTEDTGEQGDVSDPEEIGDQD